jgi:hypothetical protein
MEILDEDMQMVRDFLKDAPEYIKGHFENLVSEHAKEADVAATLKEQVESLESNEAEEIEKLQDRIGELEDTLDDLCGDGMRGALETVKYWLHDVLVLKRPMRIMPREVLRIVEDVL